MNAQDLGRSIVDAATAPVHLPNLSRLEDVVIAAALEKFPRRSLAIAKALGMSERKLRERRRQLGLRDGRLRDEAKPEEVQHV